MVESSNTEFGQSDDSQKGRSLDRDRQGSMPIAGPEMNRHLRRAGYARQVGELSDVDLETSAPTNGQALVYNATTEVWEPANNLVSGSLTGLGLTATAAFDRQRAIEPVFGRRRRDSAR